jgi:2-(1,2-epoxy-1,2-dihydrophenyl)acetyl-CoA isomerase
MPHPVVARVHGAVAGFGLSLMNACDLVVAADDAYFTSAYRYIALTPDGGGSWSLPRLVGLRRAMEIFLLGERFDAAEARRLGLVNKVVPAAELDRTLDAIVGSLVAGPRDALRSAKRLVRESLARTLSEQLEAEAVSFGRATASPDFDEGIGAFLAKRTPQFGR